MNPYNWLVFKLSKRAPIIKSLSLLGVGEIGTFFFMIGWYSSSGFHDNEFFPTFWYWLFIMAPYIVAVYICITAYRASLTLDQSRWSTKILRFKSILLLLHILGEVGYYVYRTSL